MTTNVLLPTMDIMVDIETLGLAGTSQILQIAAISYHRESGHIYGKFEGVVELPDKIEVNPDTLLFWIKENPVLLTSLMTRKSGQSEKDVVKAFADWIVYQTESNYRVKDVVMLWGNGANFDNRIIFEKCQAYGIDYPISYRNDRDFRTLVELYIDITGDDYEKFKTKILGLAIEKCPSMIGRKFVKHDALCDCVFQILQMIAMYTALAK